MNLATLNLPANADTAMVWAAGREHELRADAYAWHRLLSEPARSSLGLIGLYLEANDGSA